MCDSGIQLAAPSIIMLHAPTERAQLVELAAIIVFDFLYSVSAPQCQTYHRSQKYNVNG